MKKSIKVQKVIECEVCVDKDYWRWEDPRYRFIIDKGKPEIFYSLEAIQEQGGWKIINDTEEENRAK